jgi:hypothetical protein
VEVRLFSGILHPKAPHRCHYVTLNAFVLRVLHSTAPPQSLRTFVRLQSFALHSLREPLLNPPQVGRSTIAFIFSLQEETRQFLTKPAPYCPKLVVFRHELSRRAKA